jgi:hypothetical protein
LRAVLVAILVYHLVGRNWAAASVAGQGALVLLIPPAISRFSRWHVPRLLELAFVAGMFLQYGSESFKLFELLTYWDKIAHPAEILFATMVATFLLLGYRELHRLEIPDGLSAAGAMLFGMTLGSSFELIEFALDWFGNANLQKSNADTITDILTNDFGAIFGALAAFWLYRHRTDQHQRAEFGELAEWLTGRLARLFTRHGTLVGIVVALLFALIILAGWLVDRGPIPPPPSALGRAASWTFGPTQALDTSAQPLSGDWSFEARGVCRVNPDRPLPGSETMGLFELNPGASYGGENGFSAATQLLAERPPLGAGTAMDVGLAFGLRGPNDFYLARLSVIHDVLRLERYLHGRRRDVREVHLLSRGNEWHQLRLHQIGDQVSIYLDDRLRLQEAGLAEPNGGLALWARVTTAGCFSTAAVQPLPVIAAAWSGLVPGRFTWPERPAAQNAKSGASLGWRRAPSSATPWPGPSPGRW